MIAKYFLITLLSLAGFGGGDPPELSQDEMLSKINAIRSQGCFCGRRWMEPAAALKWDDILYRSASDHAKEMYDKNYFSHFSSSGLDIGQRLDNFGYPWQVAGENIGEGQRSFDEVMRDWLKSYSHCKMLMNPKVDEIAIARYKKYWVQHFGKKMPEGFVRKS